MDSTKYVLFCIFGVLLNVSVLRMNGVNADDVNETQKSNATIAAEKKPTYSVPFISNDLSSWKTDVGQVLVIGSIVISSLVIIGVVAWLLSPVLGYRLCTILGNCETEVVSYSNGGNLQNFMQPNAFPNVYNTYDSAYNGGYQKRSLNYVGPILKTLASAYEKYEQSSTSSPKKE
ncbi:hypothetical protein PGB90_006857 [Kerria lacca]